MIYVNTRYQKFHRLTLCIVSGSSSHFYPPVGKISSAYFFVYGQMNFYYNLFFMTFALAKFCIYPFPVPCSLSPVPY